MIGMLGTSPSASEPEDDRRKDARGREYLRDCLTRVCCNAWKQPREPAAHAGEDTEHCRPPRTADRPRGEDGARRNPPPPAVLRVLFLRSGRLLRDPPCARGNGCGGRARVAAEP